MNSALARHSPPVPVAQRRRARLSNATLFAATIVLLLAAPLAFGAVQPWAVFLLETSASALLLAWGLRQWKHQELVVDWQPIYAPMLAFATLVLVQWITGITAYRQVTYSLILLYFSYGILAFVAGQTLRRSSQIRSLAALVCGYGLVVASFSLLQGIAPNGKLYWIWPLEQGGLIYGPYVNHNHYAGLMEMLTPFPLVLALSRHTEGNRKLIVAGIAALMAGTIFLSGSRGGMLAFVVQVIALAILLRKRGDWKQPVALGVFLAVMIVFLIWLGGNELTHRLVSIQSEARQELTGGVRLTIDRDCLRMLREKPLLGWGLGTFPSSIPNSEPSTPASSSTRPTTITYNCWLRLESPASPSPCGSSYSPFVAPPPNCRTGRRPSTAPSLSQLSLAASESSSTVSSTSTSRFPPMQLCSTCSAPSRSPDPFRNHSAVAPAITTSFLSRKVDPRSPESDNPRARGPLSRRHHREVPTSYRVPKGFGLLRRCFP